MKDLNPDGEKDHMFKALIYGAIVALFVMQTANVPPVHADPHIDAQAHASSR